MPIESFKQEWQLVKKNYEKATGKKRPSAKLAGATKNASGLEPACASLDTALAKGDHKAAEKANDTLQHAGAVYQKALVEATKGEDRNISTELQVMIGEITNIMKEAKARTSALSDHGSDMDARRTAWKGIADLIVRSEISNNAALRDFTAKKEFGRHVVTGEDNRELQTLQSKAKQQLAAYAKALGVVKSAKIDPADPKAIKDFAEKVMLANDELSLTNGVLQTLGMWRTLVAGTPQQVQAYNNSDLKNTMDQANEALSAENERLAKLQQSYERQVERSR